MTRLPEILNIPQAQEFTVLMNLINLQEQEENEK